MTTTLATKYLSENKLANFLSLIEISSTEWQVEFTWLDKDKTLIPCILIRLFVENGVLCVAKRPPVKELSDDVIKSAEELNNEAVKFAVRYFKNTGKINNQLEILAN